MFKSIEGFYHRCQDMICAKAVLNSLRTTRVGTPFIYNQVCERWAMNAGHIALLCAKHVTY